MHETSRDVNIIGLIFIRSNPRDCQTLLFFHSINSRGQNWPEMLKPAFTCKLNGIFNQILCKIINPRPQKCHIPRFCVYIDIKKSQTTFINRRGFAMVQIAFHSQLVKPPYDSWPLKCQSRLADDIFKACHSYFSEEIMLDITCESSAWQTIRM